MFCAPLANQHAEHNADSYCMWGKKAWPITLEKKKPGTGTIVHANILIYLPYINILCEGVNKTCFPLWPCPERGQMVWSEAPMQYEAGVVCHIHYLQITSLQASVSEVNTVQQRPWPCCWMHYHDDTPMWGGQKVHTQFSVECNSFIGGRTLGCVLFITQTGCHFMHF